MLNRREFVAAAGSLLALPNTGDTQLLMITAAEAKRMREAAARTHPMLVTLAEKASNAPPWSVTFHRPKASETAAGPNDYFSEGPYWWPNPNNQAGPYVRRDGERNPNRFTANHNDLGNMCESVLALGIGAYILGNAASLPHAAEILSVWFIDPKTRMNPNLEYGQAIPGVSSGRGTGIIDTVSLIHAAQGIVLLEAAGGLDTTVARAVRQWFADYLQWMMTSAKGQDEKMSGNNHATWWTAQVAAYAALTGNTGARAVAWQHCRNYLVPTEIRQDGSCPREEARTNSLGYSSMNLDAFATICRLAQIDGVDLWHFRTSREIGVEKAFYYLMPYVLHPNTWQKQQISSYNANGYIFPALAGVGLPSPQLLSDYDQLSRADTAWVQFIDLLVKSGSGLKAS